MKTSLLRVSPRLWLIAVCLAWPVLNGRAEPPEHRLPPLNTAKGSPQIPGKFVWADLITDDAQAARTFYGRLFGWTFREVGGYTIAENHERPLCGFIQQPKPKDRPAQPRWLAFVSVPNVSRAQKAITKAGGKVLAPPSNYPNRGEQAVFADPEGAIFGTMKSSSGDPQDFLADPGDWIWIQLLSRDAKKTADFYRIVGDYDVRENTASTRLSDYVLVSDGYARASVRTIPANKPEVRPAWLPFVRVKSISESVDRARQLGGKVLIEPKPELLGGKVAVIADTTGAAVGILEWPEGAMKGGR